MEKIAILTDTCSDVPSELIEKYHIYQLPLGINYKEKSYRDRMDITPETVYENLNKEIPKTSLPTMGEIEEILQGIYQDGYTHVVIPVLSSGLSGTYQAVQLVCNDFSQLTTAVIDTKNIAIASGFFALYAAQLLEQGNSFSDIVRKLNSKIKNSHVFYSLQTLQYLIKGGRLGRVEGVLGSLLQIKPIISCDEQGVYYTVEKVRGRNQSIKRMVEIVESHLSHKTNYYFAICHGGAPQEAEALKQVLQKYTNQAIIFAQGQISPALGVHTGPGLVGIGYFDLDDEA